MDIPEMKYTSDDKDEEGRPTPRGEIWIRGDTIFEGYYKDKAKTEEAITPDGWLQTGDVGMLLPGSNAMRIIDRKKNIFKLQQGEYVAAEKVEGIYCRSPLINEAFLHGDSYQSFPVAVVTVDKAGIEGLAAKQGIKKPFEEACKDKAIRTLLCREMESVGKEGGLKGFEQAKNVYIETEPLFMNKGILSTTMKMQRFAARQVYAAEIEQMYKEGPLQTK